MATVSVIMVTHNQGAYLLEAVDSILGQSLPDLELVLVDNHSTDGSFEQLRAARPDPRIKFICHGSNLGIARGITSAFPLCTAPWIAIMDADDRSHPLRLELQLRALATDPSLDMMASGALWMDATGRVTGVYRTNYEPGDIAAYAPYHMPVLHPTLLGRAEIFRTVPYREECQFASDYDWFLRVGERYKTGGISLPLYYYRAHPHSSTVAHAKLSRSIACAIRLLHARRRAGREEHFPATLAEAVRLAAGPADLAAIYQQFARRFHAEGFHLQAAFHAALAVRSRPGPGCFATYSRMLCAAWWADRGALGPILGGLGKLPFWVLLQRAGFPEFPRY